jgi:hypothetical protein
VPFTRQDGEIHPFGVNSGEEPEPVLQASQVRCGNQQYPLGSQNAPKLTDEHIGVNHVFNDLAGKDSIEPPISNWQWERDVAHDALNSFGQGGHRVGPGFFNPNNLPSQFAQQRSKRTIS